MCGESKRFKNQGYKDPKFTLSLKNKSIFFHVVRGFSDYFNIDTFIFIINRSKHKSFINSELSKLGLKKYKIILLKSKTNGQAETVYKGIKNLEIKNGIYIFNIDTIHKKFKKKKITGDGYWEVFNGKGNTWSFAKVKNNNIILTTEKNRISNLCSNGLYFFKKKKYFTLPYESLIKFYKLNKNELYVSLLFNELIKMKKKIKIKKINLKDMIFCGTPAEYKNAKKINSFL